MSRWSLSSFAAAGLLAMASPAVAQTDPELPPSAGDAPPPATQPVAVTTTTTTTTARAAQEAETLRSHQLLEYQGQEFGLGWRQWFVGIPSGIVGLFVHVEPGWAGSYVTPAMGPEFTYRNHGFEIDIAGMYVGYQSPAGVFRAETDPVTSSERVQSNLWGLFVTAHFMWAIRLHRMFEIQIGGGLGIGYLGGNLNRTEVYPSAGATEQGSPGTNGWRECAGFGAPNAEYCNNAPGHYTTNGPNGGRYAEPNWFNGGSVPSILPWISIPQVAFHLRPHRHVDVKLEVGFGLIDIYGGISAHYIF